VETFKRSEDGKALILRLFGVSGAPLAVDIRWGEPRPAKVFRSDLSEKPLSRIPGPVEIPAYGIVTLRAELP
jgi:alpha-mannosidase